MKAQQDRVEPKLPAKPIDHVAEVERELDAFMKGNDAMLPTPAKQPREQAEFVALTRQAVKAMIASHENAVTEAQNRLEEIKIVGERMLGEIEKREQELADMTANSKQFASDTLDICKRYEGTK